MPVPVNQLREGTSLYLALQRRIWTYALLGDEKVLDYALQDAYDSYLGRGSILRILGRTNADAKYWESFKKDSDAQIVAKRLEHASAKLDSLVWKIAARYEYENYHP